MESELGEKCGGCEEEKREGLIGHYGAWLEMGVSFR